jgi:hypothetical protein
VQSDAGMFTLFVHHGVRGTSHKLEIRAFTRSYHLFLNDIASLPVFKGIVSLTGSFSAVDVNVAVMSFDDITWVPQIVVNGHDDELLSVSD